MRNASGHQGKNEWQQKKVNRNTYSISSIKRVTRKLLEVSRYSRAKQWQRIIHKKCAARVKLFFMYKLIFSFFLFLFIYVFIYLQMKNNNYKYVFF